MSIKSENNTKVNGIVLGCGCSIGVPLIGCKCEVCISKNIKNIRLRSSILLIYQGRNILIDCGPDIKTQLLQNNISKIDYLIITHQHYDHISGLNELRTIRQENDIIIYTIKEVAEYLLQKYPYIFSIDRYKVTITIKIVQHYDIFYLDSLNDFKINLIFTYHAKAQGINNIAIKINNFLYANDLIQIPEKSMQYFYNLDLLVLDCKNYKNTKMHIGLETVLDWSSKYNPRQIFLTNMSHEFDYDRLKNILPPNIIPCFDSMKFDFCL